MPIRVGILGYGQVVQYFLDRFAERGNEFELIFIWNRTTDKLLAANINRDLVVEHLSTETIAHYASKCDIVCEASHPNVTKQWGTILCSTAHYFCCSPTVFADRDVYNSVVNACDSHDKALFVPVGAFWGAQDLMKLDGAGKLESVTITMRKHPSSFKLVQPFTTRDEVINGRKVQVIEDTVDRLCRIAPNNVNTMAVCALCASSLGFSGVRGAIILDESARNFHEVRIIVCSPKVARRSEAIDDGNSESESCDQFKVETTRMNPATAGNVTATATFTAIFSSFLTAVEMVRNYRVIKGVKIV